MSLTPIPLASGQGTGSNAAILTAPTNTTYVIKHATLNNTTGGAITYKATFNDPSAIEIITDRPLASKKDDQPPPMIGLTLIPGQSLSLNAPVGVTYVLSGLAVV